MSITPNKKITSKNCEDLILWYINNLCDTYPNLTPIISTFKIKESKTLNTMAVAPAIDGGTWLLFNRAFIVRNHTFFQKKNVNPENHYISNVIKHELLHIILKHHLKIQEFSQEQERIIYNIATDTIINSQIDWSQGQIILGINNPEKKGIKDDGVIYAKLTKNKKGHSEKFNFYSPICLDEFSQITSLVSPFSVWYGIVQSITEDLHLFLANKLIKEKISVGKKFIDVQKDTGIYRQYILTLDDKQEIFNTDFGFINIDILPPKTKQIFEKNKYSEIQIHFNEIIKWFNQYVNLRHKQKIETSTSWFSIYCKLYENYNAIKELIKSESKSFNPYDKNQDQIGDIGERTESEVENVLGETDSQNNENQKEFSEKTEQSIKKIISIIFEKSTTKWIELLDKAISSNNQTKQEETIFRPSRRWGYAKPGIKTKNEGTVNIAIDTSGSINERVLNKLFQSLSFEVNKRKNLKFNICFFNTAVYSKQLNWKPGEKITTQNGGTNFELPLKQLEEFEKNYGGISIMFTDGICKIPEKSNYSRKFIRSLAWVIWPQGDQDKQYFGDIGVIKMTE